MLRYMLGTDTCIHVIKTYPAELREQFNSAREELCISSIVLSELHFGAEKSQRTKDNLAEIALFVGRLAVLPYGSNAAVHYGLIRAALRRLGTPIGPNDLFIAAHARSEGLILVTNNRREFDRVPGLLVENWL